MLYLKALRQSSFCQLIKTIVKQLAKNYKKEIVNKQKALNVQQGETKLIRLTLNIYNVIEVQIIQKIGSIQIKENISFVVKSRLVNNLSVSLRHNQGEKIQRLNQNEQSQIGRYIGIKVDDYNKINRVKVIELKQVMNKNKIYKFSVSQILVKHIKYLIYQSIKYKSFQQESKQLIKKEQLLNIIQQVPYKKLAVLVLKLNQQQVQENIQDKKRKLSDKIFSYIKRYFT
ncbi:hypothetical protein ABPG72_008969 [Tetrahymena utriculariae]